MGARAAVPGVAGPGPGRRGLAFRSATEADVEAIVALVESAYRGEESRLGWTHELDLVAGQRTDTRGVARLVASPEARIILATSAGELVGCCEIERRSDDLAYFGLFSVRPDRQGGGFGRALMAEAERVAHQEWGATEMTLQVIHQRLELIAWYERLGYRSTGERVAFPYDDPKVIPVRPDLAFAVMRKPLG